MKCLRVLSFLFLLVGITVNLYSQSQRSLTVDEIIKLHKGGISEQLLIQMIEVSGSTYQLTTDDIFAMREARLPDGVLLAMLKKKASEEKPDQLPSPQEKTIILPKGTSIAVRLLDTIGTRINKPGDIFECTVDEDIVVDGSVTIHRGAPALGRIISSNRAGRVSGRATLAIELTKIQTTSGAVGVTTEMGLKGGASAAGRDAAMVAGSVATGALLDGLEGALRGVAIGGAISLVTRGPDIKLEPETWLLFQLKEPILLTPTETREDLSQLFNEPKRYGVYQPLSFARTRRAILEISKNGVEFTEYKDGALITDSKHNFKASCSEVKLVKYTWWGDASGHMVIKLKNNKDHKFFAGDLASTIISRIRRNCELGPILK